MRENVREGQMRSRTDQIVGRSANCAAARVQQRATGLRPTLGTHSDQAAVPVREPMLQGVRADTERAGDRIR